MDILYGSATKRVAFINLNWEIIDSKDIFKICESLVCNVEVVKICKSRRYNEVQSHVKASSKREYKEEQLNAIKNKYIGVIECSSIEDSIRIYKELDGKEIENSGMYFDLRFIPEDYVLGEICNKCSSSADYVAKDFNKINESYEERRRKMLLNQLFNSKDVKSNLLSQIISLSDEEDDIDDNKDKVESKSRNKSLKEKIYNHTKSSSSVNIPDEAEILDEEKEKATLFTFNTSDQRFFSLYTNEDFTIDPSDPEYKRNNHLSSILKEKRSRYKEET